MTDEQADEMESKLAQGDELIPGDVRGWEWVLLQQEYETHLREQKIPALAALGEIEDVEAFYPGCEAFLRRVVQEAPFGDGFWQHSRWPELVRLASRFLVASRRNVDWPELGGIMPHECALPRAEEASAMLQRIMATQDSEASIQDAIEESFSPRPFWGSRFRQWPGDTTPLLLAIFVGLEEGGFWSQRIDSDEEWIGAWRDEKLSRMSCFDRIEEDPDDSVFMIIGWSRESVMEDRLQAYLRLYSIDNAWTLHMDGELLFFWNRVSRSLVFTTNVDQRRAIKIATAHEAAWIGFTHSGEWVTWLKVDRVLCCMAMTKGLASHEFDPEENIKALLRNYSGGLKGVLSN